MTCDDLNLYSKPFPLATKTPFLYHQRINNFLTIKFVFITQALEIMLRTVPTMDSLRIRSVHLQILGFPIANAYIALYFKAFFRYYS